MFGLNKIQSTDFDQRVGLVSKLAYQYQQFYYGLMGLLLINSKEKLNDLILLATVLKLEYQNRNKPM